MKLQNKKDANKDERRSRWFLGGKILRVQKTNLGKARRRIGGRPYEEQVSAKELVVGEKKMGTGGGGSDRREDRLEND